MIKTIYIPKWVRLETHEFPYILITQKDDLEIIQPIAIFKREWKS